MDTSASFLDALRDATDDDAWSQLVELYSPLIRGWLKRHGAPAYETDDLVQEVLTRVLRKIPEFRRAPHTGAFRGWLRAITANCLREHWRRGNKGPAAAGGSDFAEMINQLEDPHSGLSQLWNREHDRHVTEYLLDQIRPQFKEQTFRAFRRFALDGLSADEVAQELGISTNAVFIAKSRVMNSLRQRCEGLVDFL